MKPTIAVTGAYGFLGSAVVSRLSTQDVQVKKIVRNGILDDLNQITIGDISSFKNWNKALVNVDFVVHCAARVHAVKETATDPLKAFRAVNTEGTLSLARHAIFAGVRRFIFVSSVKVNGEATNFGVPFIESDSADPRDAYGISKCEAERGLRDLAAKSDMEVVIIRPPLVYGPGVKANFASLMRAVTRGWPLPLGALQNQRSFVALDNLVDFILTCISHPLAANQTFLVSDGHDLSTTELVRGLARAANVPERLLPVPFWALQAGARLLGKGDTLQRVCGNLQVDISKARSLLGWEPPISVEEGLRRAVSGMAT